MSNVDNWGRLFHKATCLLGVDPLLDTCFINPCRLYALSDTSASRPPHLTLLGVWGDSVPTRLVEETKQDMLQCAEISTEQDQLLGVLKEFS